MIRSIEELLQSNGHLEGTESHDRTDRDRTSTTTGGDAANGSYRNGHGRETANARGEEKPTITSTGRWRGIVAIVLLAVASGVLAKRPSLLLVAAVGIVFATYPHVVSVPDPDLSIDRRIEPKSADRGDVVDVRTTVKNEGDRPLFDLRIVDGVPPMLSVCGGSPRCATALGSGGKVTLEYELRARPGRHGFQPTAVLCRDTSGSVELETTLVEPNTIECAARIPTVPLRAQSRNRTGSLVTDEGGSGLEFHSIKEYERGDATSRIDWRRFARTGKLTSVAFRTERLADVVLCVDARPAAYRARDASEPHAVAYAVDAADRIGEALFEVNHRVGLAAFGREVCLLPLGSGRDHADRFHRRLTSAPALTLVPPPSVRTSGSRSETDPEPTSNGADTIDRQLSKIRAQFGRDIQLILLSPLCDKEPARIAQRFESGGVTVTVVSPDVTTDRTVGGRLSRLERDSRVRTLRNANVPVVDWDPTTPLGSALASLEWWNR